MNSPETITGGIIALLIVLCLVGIRFRIISSKLAGLIMIVGPFMINAIISTINGDDYLEIICIGTLLSLAFGPSTFYFGRIVEKKANQEQS